MFEKVVHLPQAEKLALLSSECKGDALLMQAVLDLLQCKPDESFLRDFSLAGYEIQAELSTGGQAIVYKAMQLSTSRTVAIKVLHEHRDQPHHYARFKREIHLLAAARHPNIVAIHDAGVNGGRPYYVMDFIQGCHFDQWASAQGRSLRSLSTLMATVCDAVQVAHQREVIHRDLKPSNIIVDATGQPHVLDFGLAKVQEALGHTLSVEGFVGTPPWASPEQATGDPACMDTRSDVYTLGVLFYHGLTGAFPYDITGSLAVVLDRIRTVEPTPPTKLCKQLPRDLETIILRALSKEPGRRYQSAGDLANDIRRFLSGRPIAARRDDAFYRAYKWLRRHPLHAASSLLLLALVVSIVTFLKLHHDAWDRDRLAQLALSRSEESQLRNFIPREEGSYYVPIVFGDICVLQESGEIAMSRPALIERILERLSSGDGDQQDCTNLVRGLVAVQNWTRARQPSTGQTHRVRVMVRMPETAVRGYGLVMRPSLYCDGQLLRPFPDVIRVRLDLRPPTGCKWFRNEVRLPTDDTFELWVCADTQVKEGSHVTYGVLQVQVVRVSPDENWTDGPCSPEYTAPEIGVPINLELRKERISVTSDLPPARHVIPSMEETFLSRLRLRQDGNVSVSMAMTEYWIPVRVSITSPLLAEALERTLVCGPLNVKPGIFQSVASSVQERTTEARTPLPMIERNGQLYLHPSCRVRVSPAADALPAGAVDYLVVDREIEEPIPVLVDGWSTPNP